MTKIHPDPRSKENPVQAGVKVAIIGAGRMGRRHLDVVKALGLELVAVCDAQSAALAAAQRDYAISQDVCYSDAEKMLREIRPQLVIVATTAPTHCRYTLLAAASGARYVLCEKPMAVSLAECDAMIAACRDAGGRLAINHQMRFMEQYTEPCRMLQSPEFGGVRAVTVVAGNFGLAMNGSHYFEMFRYMTGEPPAEVSAWFSPERVPNPRGPQFEDRAGCVRMVTASGVRFYMDASSDQGHGFQCHYAARLGQLTVDEATGTLRTTVREEAHRGQPSTRYLMPFQVNTRAIEPADAVTPTRRVLEALLRGDDFPTGEDGRLAVNVLVAAHVSDAEGHRAVRLDDPAIDRRRDYPWA